MPKDFYFLLCKFFSSNESMTRKSPMMRNCLLYTSVNVTVNVSREDVKVEKPVEAAPAPAETPAEEKAE